jgi:hypothetical protein
MSVIFDRLTGLYFKNYEWVDKSQFAEQLTYPRASEILESLMLQVSKGWIKGDYVIQEYER